MDVTSIKCYQGGNAGEGWVTAFTGESLIYLQYSEEEEKPGKNF